MSGNIDECCDPGDAECVTNVVENLRAAFVDADHVTAEHIAEALHIRFQRRMIRHSSPRQVAFTAAKRMERRRMLLPIENRTDFALNVLAAMVVQEIELEHELRANGESEQGLRCRHKITGALLLTLLGDVPVSTAPDGITDSPEDFRILVHGEAVQFDAEYWVWTSDGFHALPDRLNDRWYVEKVSK